MKKNNYVLSLLIISILLFSCDVKNPTEGLEVRIQTISRTTGINVKLLDAATSQPIEKTVNVKFVGENKAQIITSSNSPITEVSTKAGIAVFALEDEIIPSANKPVLLSFVVSSDGYVETAKQIKITKAGISNFSVSLANIMEPPSGVAANSENTGQTDGSSGTSDDAVVSSGQDSQSGGEAAVVIPAGTVLQDDQGNALSGTVETTVVYINTTEQEALSSLAGGSDVGVVDADNNLVDGQLVLAGAVTVRMTVDGQNVSQVGGSGINVTMSVPTAAINPKTGSGYQEGESIGVWGYNPEKSTWKWIKDIIIIPAGSTDGRIANIISFDSGFVSPFYYVSFSSFSGLDRFESFGVAVGNVAPGVGTCEKTINIESTTGLSGTVYLDVETEFLNLAALAPNFVANFSIAVVHGVQVIIKAPDNLPPVTVKVYDKPLTDALKQLLGTKSISDFCSASSPITVSYTPLVTNIIVAIEVTVKCDSQTDNPRVVIPSGFSLWARQVNQSGTETIGSWEPIGGFVYDDAIQKSKVTASLIDGKYYEFKTEYDSEFYYSQDYEPPFQATTGGISYSIVDDSRVCDNF